MRESGHAAPDVAAAISAEIKRRSVEFLSLLDELVSIDSGRDAPEGIAKVQDVIANRLTRLEGVAVERHHQDGVAHLAVVISGGDARVALLGHADTVLARGTAAERPLRVEGHVGYGPGVADMKGGLAMATLICEALVDLGDHPTIELVIVGDEETRVVAPPFMDRLESADACFVLECGRPGGGYIVRRKGGLWARMEAKGRSAHAGVQPDWGTSAIVQLCQTVGIIAELHRVRDDLTVSVGTIAGGSAPNVVAAEAWADVDIRAFRDDDLDWARRRVFDICERASLSVHETGRWPPMGLVDESLSSLYQDAGRGLSVPLHPESTGGMSDGCWTSTAGIPTIDGVGPEGSNDHSPEEYIDLASVPARAGALAGAITATTRNDRSNTERGEKE